MDQAERLRSLMNSRSSRARVIAVASGKGGVGKTNISVNLAVAMTRLGRRVVLADLDIGLSNADVLLDVHPKFNLSHVLSGEVSPLDVLVKTPSGAPSKSRRTPPGSSWTTQRKLAPPATTEWSA